MRFGWRWREHEIEPGLTVTLPAGWEQRPGNVKHGLRWTAHSFVKDERWWWGAGTPQEVRAWIIVGGPGANTTAMEAAMAEAFADLLGDTRRFPEFGSFLQEGAETWISDGNYQISPLHDPQKVILQRSIDREKRLAFVARVYQKRVSHQRLREIRGRFYRSAVRARSGEE